MASSSANSVMQRSDSDPLQCPRCNSSNTKFCYYNNYSLSQPRHFCKVCKRYWTSGGTLRNVPIGGRYRKTKKFKRHQPPTSGSGDGLPSAAAAAPMIKPSSLQPDIPNRINNPFHSMPTNFNFPFSESRVSSDSPRFDYLPPTDDLRLGFSPDFRIGFQQNIEDRSHFISFGSSNFARRDRFSSSTPYEEMQMVVGNGQIGKESNQNEQMNSSSYLWNSNNVGVWFDPSSAVPSQIQQL